jgi:hypothetical protein
VGFVAAIWPEADGFVAAIWLEVGLGVTAQSHTPGAATMVMTTNVTNGWAFCWVIATYATKAANAKINMLASLIKKPKTPADGVMAAATTNMVQPIAAST